MKIRILPFAYNDLAHGRDFYEQQGEGLGSYFLDTLLSDIDSLVLYARIHRKVFDFHRLLFKRFPHNLLSKRNGKRSGGLSSAGLPAKPAQYSLCFEEVVKNIVAIT